MSEIYLFTGGARSGKSTMAENTVRNAAVQAAAKREAAPDPAGAVLYIATAAVCDEEMEERVKKHRAQRPASWPTLEAFWNFDALEENPDFQNCDAVLLDCMGFMLNNIMYYSNIDWENLPLSDMARVEERMIAELKTLMATCRKNGKTLVLVTNEVGMGLVPEHRSSRYYRDILGRANRTAAEEADHVCFMVSGLPLWVKGGAALGSAAVSGTESARSDEAVK